MNTPEKVYCTPTEGGFYFTTIKPEPPFAEGVEYIMKDDVIEKVCEYMSYHLDTSKIDANYKFEFIEEIRNYMKGK